MLYLAAIFTPPLYFMIQKKWVAAAVTSVLFVISLAFWLAIPVFWLISAVCAIWDLRKSLMHEHAAIMAQKMAAAMREQPPPISR